MSEPRPPSDDSIRLVSRDQVDTRDINMNRLEPKPANASSPSSPFPDVVNLRDGRTLMGQPDGSYTLAPTPPPPPA